MNGDGGNNIWLGGNFFIGGGKNLVVRIESCVWGHGNSGMFFPLTGCFDLCYSLQSKGKTIKKSKQFAQ